MSHISVLLEIAVSGGGRTDKLIILGIVIATIKLIHQPTIFRDLIDWNSCL